MLSPPRVTLAQARSYLAALADQASTIDASSAYEHVLIELDRIHGDECPADRHATGSRGPGDPARGRDVMRSRNSSSTASTR